jgi:hypothetical protein
MSTTKIDRLKALVDRLENDVDHEKEFYQVLTLLEEEYATENGFEGEGKYNQNLAKVLKTQANNYLQYINSGQEKSSGYFYQEFVNQFKLYAQDEIFRIRAI